MKKINLAFYLILILLMVLGIVSTFFYMYLITTNAYLQAKNEEIESNLELLSTEYYTINSIVYGRCDKDDCLNTFEEYPVVNNTITLKRGDMLVIKLDRTITDTITVSFNIVLRPYLDGKVEKSPENKRLEYVSSLQPVSSSVVSVRPDDYTETTGQYKEIIEGRYTVTNEYSSQTKTIYNESPIFVIE